MIKTVLFTDIESSTQLTEQLGDQAAHRLTRLHNAAVRKAIRLNNGIEIKHTGDGIMAAYAAASCALDSAIAIQRWLSRYDKRVSSGLRVNIGINAGEPIVDGSDLFGTAVQIAARLCAAARDGEILVSEVIKLLLAGKHYTFTNQRELPLKGLSQPIIVYGVDWQH